MFDQFVGASTRLATTHAVKAADHLEVFSRREVLVDRGVLPREADERAHSLRFRNYVDTRNPCPTFIGLDERRQNRDRSRLACAVRPEEAQNRSCGNCKVETIEGGHRAVSLDDCICFNSDAIQETPC